MSITASNYIGGKLIMRQNRTHSLMVADAAKGIINPEYKGQDSDNATRTSQAIDYV